jgi:hypothetical protein
MQVGQYKDTIRQNRSTYLKVSFSSTGTATSTPLTKTSSSSPVPASPTSTPPGSRAACSGSGTDSSSPSAPCTRRITRAALIRASTFGAWSGGANGRHAVPRRKGVRRVRTGTRLADSYQLPAIKSAPITKFASWYGKVYKFGRIYIQGVAEFVQITIWKISE